MKPIILTSTSPRRKELLDVIGLPYYIIEPQFEEVINEDAQKKISAHFAEQKVYSVLTSLQGKHLDANLVLGADTVILCQNSILGKPSNIDEARAYLKKISGITHEVETSFAIYNRKTQEMISKTSTNIVHVQTLRNVDIEWYLAKNEWQDAAGAYKIQGAFQRYINKIEGTQSSVMGLPLSEFCDIVATQGYDFS